MLSFNHLYTLSIPIVQDSYKLPISSLQANPTHLIPFFRQNLSLSSSELLRFLSSTPNSPNTSLFHFKLWQSWINWQSLFPHFPIFSFPHFLILSFSHFLISKFSHSLIFTFSHFQIFSFSHFHIFSFPNFLISKFSHSLIFSFANFFPACVAHTACAARTSFSHCDICNILLVIL